MNFNPFKHIKLIISLIIIIVIIEYIIQLYGIYYIWRIIYEILWWKIQKHLLNGGKIKRTNQNFSYFLSESLKRFCYKYNNEIREYSISKQDLEADDWTIVEPEYD